MTPSGTAENYINRAAVCGQTNKQFTPFITSFGLCRKIEYYYRITYVVNSSTKWKTQSPVYLILDMTTENCFNTYRKGQSDGISM